MPVGDLLPLSESEKEGIQKMAEPKSVTVRVSVQLREKMVELNLGKYTLEMIYNEFLNHGCGCSAGHPVSSVLTLALGYTGEVERLLRDRARVQLESFRELLWEWIAERLEELA